MPRSRPAIRFEWLARERLLVFCQSGLEPSAEEWKAYVDTLMRVTATPIRCFAYSDGGRPTRKQQDAVMSLPGFGDWPIAMVSPSPGIRFMASTVALHTSKFQLFSPSELDEAYLHLGATPEEIGVIEDCVQRLRDQLYEGTVTPPLRSAR
ncbi:MAG: hypothetical protein ABW321_33370 [Polyangiales bacterium]